MPNKQEQREKTRQRIRAATDPESYDYRPETVRMDYVKDDEFQRVAIYARVSTNNPEQTSSFELQQKYYLDLISKRPKWKLVKIYADEGISGVTMQHREQFLQMMEDAEKGLIDLIIVKNISRLARNVVDFLSTINKLAEKKVGVLFESEAIYSLNFKSHMSLTFMATIAEEESRIRSRSMETSLRMRLDHGLPLTPELLGFVKDEDGKLVINPETYRTPKLIFSMYLYGYSTAQIAEKLKALSRETYLGNINWTAGGVANTLKNERYCGDVQTRKRFRVFPADVPKDGQKSFKNRGEKPQSYYRKEHDAIVSRDDFVAVQRIMNNAKYGGSSILPELRVIPSGLLRGFVIVHPHWASFTAADYLNACRSVGTEEVDYTVPKGDLTGYEIADSNLFTDQEIPHMSLQEKYITFGTLGIRKMNVGPYVEMLIHPEKKEIAVRPTSKDSRYMIHWARAGSPCTIGCQAYIRTIFDLFGWDISYQYKLYGCIYRDGKDAACIFSAKIPAVYINKTDLEEQIDATGQLLGQKGKRVRAFSESFGKEYYAEKSLAELRDMTREQWKMRMDGLNCNTGESLKITPYEELREFIKGELGDLFEEVQKK